METVLNKLISRTTVGALQRSSVIEWGGGGGRGTCMSMKRNIKWMFIKHRESVLRKFMSIPYHDNFNRRNSVRNRAINNGFIYCMCVEVEHLQAQDYGRIHSIINQNRCSV